jgi:hypothetical protein
MVDKVDESVHIVMDAHRKGARDVLRRGRGMSWHQPDRVECLCMALMRSVSLKVLRRSIFRKCANFNSNDFQDTMVDTSQQKHATLGEC